MLQEGLSISTDCGEFLPLYFPEASGRHHLQENYINHRPNIANNEATAMQVLAKAADAFSDGDVINRRVRMKQEWNLMPAAAMLGTVYPASYMRYACCSACHICVYSL